VRRIRLCESGPRVSRGGCAPFDEALRQRVAATGPSRNGYEQAIHRRQRRQRTGVPGSSHASRGDSEARPHRIGTESGLDDVRSDARRGTPPAAGRYTNGRDAAGDHRCHAHDDHSVAFCPTPYDRTARPTPICRAEWGRPPLLHQPDARNLLRWNVRISILQSCPCRHGPRPRLTRVAG
jgi:hypothetical protein